MQRPTRPDRPLSSALRALLVGALLLAPPARAAVAQLPLGQGTGADAPQSGDGGSADSEDARDESSSKAALDRSTPRAAVSGFLAAADEEDWVRAARYLDFHGVERHGAAPTGAERGELARQLSAVLERHVRLDLASLVDDPEGDPADSPRRSIERVGTVHREDAPDFDVLLSRVGSGEDRYWLFSESTVAAVPELYAARGYGWIEEVLPSYFFDLRLLSIELWQWIALLALVVVASILASLACFVLYRGLRLVLRPDEGELRGDLLAALPGPSRLALSTALFYLGTAFLFLPVDARDFFASACEMLAIVSVAWFLLRCVDVAQDVVSRHLDAQDRSAARSLVPMGRRFTKVLVVALALVSVVNELGFSVTGILTTLGVGGLAVALAAQKPLENLFGAVTVLSDQPVKVGDFCRVGEHIGTIEDIGLRSTRIRTLDRTLLTIPNAEFATARLENFAERDRIRLHTTLGFGYDTTPDQMRYLLVEIRRMLYAHPKTDPDPCRVRFVAFNAYSLDVELFLYIRTTDWNEFLGIREDIQLRIMDIVEESGAYFAYPSQTLYLGRDGGKDPERSAASEEQVRAWREEKALPLPTFSEQQIEEVDDTLPFPEEGSSSPQPQVAAAASSKGARSGGARRRGWRQRHRT